MMVRFDVKALFIPVKLVTEIIKKNWQLISVDTTIKSKAMYLEGISLCLENRYFKYQNEYYKHNFGVAMGGSMSLNIAGILDKTIKDTGISSKAIFKYVDDIFAIMKVDEIEIFKNRLYTFVIYKFGQASRYIYVRY